MAAPSDDDSPADSRRQFLVLATAVGLTGCTGFEGRFSSSTEASTPTPSPTSTPSPTPTPSQPRIGDVPVQRERYSLRELPYEKRPQFFGPYRQSEPECSYPVETVQDLDNLRMAEVHGQTGHFPLRTARWLLRLLHCYRVTGTTASSRRPRRCRGPSSRTPRRSRTAGSTSPMESTKAGRVPPWRRRGTRGCARVSRCQRTPASTN